jgi:leader peptidase (prepilin peptidase)/N-methyltransferase
VQSLLAIVAVSALVWGALWGSFLNVVVHRVPAGLSVVRPRSRCPSCLTPIAAHHNVPILSWLLLRGRCGHCKAPISWRYPAVELVAAALSLAVLTPWLPTLLEGTSPVWQVAVAVLAEQTLVFALLAIALIDADTFLIPDVLSLPLVVLGLGLAAVVGPARGVSWQQAAAGALVAGLGLYAVQRAYAALTGREGLGTGDVKLLAAIGAWLGLASVPAVLLLGALQGLAFALGYAALTPQAASERGLSSIRHLAVPFGPFLALGAVEWLLAHRWLLRWLPGL